MIPLRFLLIIASSDDSTIAARALRRFLGGLAIGDVLHDAEHARLILKPAALAIEPSRSEIGMQITILECDFSRLAALLHERFHFGPILWPHSRGPGARILAVGWRDAEDAIELRRQDLRPSLRIPFPSANMPGSLRQAHALFVGRDIIGRGRLAVRVPAGPDLTMGRFVTVIHAFSEQIGRFTGGVLPGQDRWFDVGLGKTSLLIGLPGGFIRGARGRTIPLEPKRE